MKFNIKNKFKNRVNELKIIKKKIKKKILKFNSKNYKKYIIKYNKINKVLNLYNIYNYNINYLNDIKILIKNKDESILYDLELEKNKVLKKIKEVHKKIKKIFKNKKKKKYKSIIMELRSGTGGEDASIFVKDILRMYIAYINKNNFKYELLNLHNSKNNIGYKEVIIRITGKDIYSFMKMESGIHRVQRIPKTEKKGRIHTSAISVVILPELKNYNLNINNNDIERKTFKSQGAGGQHVNKTESAVRVTHIPTKIKAECQTNRSQHKNFNEALQILYAKIYKYMMNKKIKKEKKNRKSQVLTGDRSEKIRTYNYVYNTLIDHRINKKFILSECINGKIDKLIKKLKKI